MSDQDRDASDEDIDRKAILARRQALVRRSMGALGTVLLGASLANCQPCLSVDVNMPGDATDTSSMDINDAGPMPCLSDVPVPIDTMDANDAMPMACLTPVQDDGVPNDATQDSQS